MKFFSLILCGALALSASGSPSPVQDEAEVQYAVIVHQDNTVDDLTLKELKKYLKLDRRHWPNKKSVVLFQRPSDTALQEYLLDEVYDMSERSLRKHFVSLLNKGSISAIPSVVASTKTIGKLVAKKKGGLAVVRADEVPEGVKLVKIDGKKPGHKGYPLVGKEKPEKEGDKDE